MFWFDHFWQQFEHISITLFCKMFVAPLKMFCSLFKMWFCICCFCLCFMFWRRFNPFFCKMLKYVKNILEHIVCASLASGRVAKTTNIGVRTFWHPSDGSVTVDSFRYSPMYTFQYLKKTFWWPELGWELGSRLIMLASETEWTPDSVQYLGSSSVNCAGWGNFPSPLCSNSLKYSEAHTPRVPSFDPKACSCRFWQLPDLLCFHLKTETIPSSRLGTGQNSVDSDKKCVARPSRSHRHSHLPTNALEKMAMPETVFFFFPILGNSSTFKMLQDIFGSLLKTSNTFGKVYSEMTVHACCKHPTIPEWLRDIRTSASLLRDKWLSRLDVHKATKIVEKMSGVPGTLLALLGP